MKSLNAFLIILLLSIVCTPGHLKAKSYLYVSDPQSWSVGGQGSIDEAVITIEPKGVYMEYNFYITFSGAGHGFDVEDTLEVNYDFSLPDNSIVHDSWLWYGEDTLIAHIMDRWSAYGIYESIVNRRRDPSILYKNYNNRYSLQIFPMAGNESRKVKISVLIPANWQSNKLYTPLPLHLFQETYTPLNKIKVVYWPDEQYGEADIEGIESVEWKNANTNEFGQHKYCYLNDESFGNSVNISFDSPAGDGYFLGTFENENENYYQLAINPAALIDTDFSSNYLFLLDFEEQENQDSPGNQVYQAMKGILKTSLNDDEQFNIFFSGTSIDRASSDWINASDVMIDSAFDEIGSSPVDDYSNLQLLLEEAINFVGDNQEQTTVILLSNSDNYSGNNAANTLYNHIKSMGDLPMFQVVDFYDGNQYAYFGNQYFRGNQYLFNLLSQNTGGNYIKYYSWEHTIPQVIAESVVTSAPLITSFDLITGMNDGFCYGRYSQHINFNKLYLNQTLIQVGKYHGSLPFSFQMSGVINDDVFQVNRTLTAGQVIQLDTLAEEAWSGNYIAALEGSGSDNQIIEEIIEESISERVLSKYTAFLAIEPGMLEQVEERENDEWLTPTDSWSGNEEWIVDLDENVSPEFAIKAFPNPFSNHIKISIDLPQDINSKGLNIQVFNHVGQLIRTFEEHELKEGESISLQWNGTDANGHEISQGIYFLVVKGNDFTKTVKLIKK
ncbi:MAG: T9SS type A sorting domain-containing protein [Bacteroidetes bacterium]|jgi:Ca-activated chloride channel family protein|nr:T9SS type A sorting domain-containing protein [Bacteroidota bacterium]